MFIAMMLVLATLQEAAATTQSKAEKAADAFTLDLPHADAASASEADATSRRTVREAPGASPSMAKHGRPQAASDAPPVVLSLDTPIRDLIADPRGRAVLDADMEGLSTDANLPKFRRISLRQFQAQTGGQLTDELLEKVAADLANPDPVIAAAAEARRKRATTGR